MRGIATRVVIAPVSLSITAETTFATPPEDATFRRSQRVDYTPTVEDLLNRPEVMIGQIFHSGLVSGDAHRGIAT